MLKKIPPATLTCVPFSDTKLIVSIANPKFRLFNQSWSINMDREGTFDFPEDLLEKLNWKVGDEVEWVNQDNGTFTLTKKTNGSKKKKFTQRHRDSSQK